MSKENKTTLIFNKLKEHHGITSDSNFAKFLGIAPTTLASWKVRDRFDYDLVYSKCVDIDANWLLTGEGPMIKNGSDSVNKPLAMPVSKPGEGIPLIPASAMAGVCTGDISVTEIECERYVVPVFRDADFLIPVKGSSMLPKYSSGDIIACTKLPLNDLFFQWNKVYVLDTVQGPLVKRIAKGTSDDTVLLISENPTYKPFELPKNQLRAVALVIGVIRLE